jgi:general secretion pathway protein J
MHARTEMRRQRGFTLLEMLVALTVLGFLMVGLNEGVRTGLGMWSREARQIGSIAELDSTARILRSLLGGIPLAPAVPADPTGSSHVIAFSGTADRLVFVGDMPTGVGTTRLADITLALRGEQLVLLWNPHRREQSATPAPPNETELLRGVARIEFAYWGTPDRDSPATWVTQWNGSAMPQLIRIRVSFPEGDRRHWPDMTVAPPVGLPQVTGPPV